MRHALRDAREARDWTQQDLVNALKERYPSLKVTRTAISKYEQGVIDIPGRVLRPLADVLNTPMHILYANSAIEDPSPTAVLP